MARRSRNLQGLAFVIAGLVVTACDTPRTREAAIEEYRPTASIERAATEAETRRILTHPPGDLFHGLPDAGRETFEPDGRYQSNGFPTVDGWYSVSGNEVCVARTPNGAATSCRRIMIGPEGPFQTPIAHAPSRINPHVTPLTEAEARSAIVGQSILPPEGSHDLPTETFDADGAYRSQGRVLRAGTYSIEGNRLCVSVPPAEDDCSYLYVVGAVRMISDEARPELVNSQTMRPLRTTRRERSRQAGDGSTRSR